MTGRELVVKRIETFSRLFILSGLIASGVMFGTFAVLSRPEYREPGPAVVVGLGCISSSCIPILCSLLYGWNNIRCPWCNHDWTSLILSMKRVRNCPYCGRELDDFPPGEEKKRLDDFA